MEQQKCTVQLSPEMLRTAWLGLYHCSKSCFWDLVLWRLPRKDHPLVRQFLCQSCFWDLVLWRLPRKDHPLVRQFLCQSDTETDSGYIFSSHSLEKHAHWILFTDKTLLIIKDSQKKKYGLAVRKFISAESTRISLKWCRHYQNWFTVLVITV